MTPPAAATAGRVGSYSHPAPARRSRPAAPARPGPARPSRPRPAAAPARRPLRTAEVAGALAPTRLLDRLIRSRAWIVLVAFALIGIVAMQLWLLKLNGGIGRAIEHEGLLQRQNAALSAENSGMSAGDLVEQQAVASGMTIVAPGKLIFLRARGSTDERLAAARLAQPVQVQAGTEAPPAGTQPTTSGAQAPSPTTTEPTPGG
jgi:hypothetical protein